MPMMSTAPRLPGPGAREKASRVFQGVQSAFGGINPDQQISNARSAASPTNTNYAQAQDRSLPYHVRVDQAQQSRAWTPRTE